MSRKGKSKITLAKVTAVPTMDLKGGEVPTLERMAKYPGVVAIASGVQSRLPQAIFASKESKPPVGADGEFRMNQEQLDRLYSRGTLDPDTKSDRNELLFRAGDLFRQHWYRGTLGDSLRSMDLNGAGGGGNGHPAWMTPSCETVAYHRAKFRAVRDQMDRDHFQIVFAVCCGDSTLEAAGRDAGFQQKNAASAVALDRLRRGLEWIAIQWGVMPPKPANDTTLDSVAQARIVVRGDEVDTIIGKMMIANAADGLARTG